MDSQKTADNTGQVSNAVLGQLESMIKARGTVDSTMNELGFCRSWLSQRRRRGPGKITLENLVRLCRVLDVQIDRFFETISGKSSAYHKLCIEGIEASRPSEASRDSDIPAVRSAVEQWRRTRGEVATPNLDVAEDLRRLDDPSLVAKEATEGLKTARGVEVAVVLAELGSSWRRCFHFRQALAALGWAAEIAEAEGSRPVRVLVSLRGRALRMDQERFAEAYELCDEAASIAAADGDTDFVGRAWLARARVAWEESSYETALHFSNRAIHVVRGKVTRANASQVAAACCNRLGEYAESEAYLKEAKALRGLPAIVRTHLAWTEAQLCRALGRFRMAKKSYLQTVEGLPPGVDAVLAISELVEMLIEAGMGIQGSELGASLASARIPLDEDPLDTKGVLRSSCIRLQRLLAGADCRGAVLGEIVTTILNEKVARRGRVFRYAQESFLA